MNIDNKMSSLPISYLVLAKMKSTASCNVKSVRKAAVNQFHHNLLFPQVWSERKVSWLLLCQTAL